MKSLKNDNIRGIILISVGFFLWSIVDTIQKFLTEEFHPLQIVWFRCVGLFICMLIYYLFFDKKLLQSESKGLNIIRGLLVVLSSLFFVTCLKFVPLADAISVTFVAPFFVTIIGFFFLNEKVGIYRFSAILVGFLGTLIIIRPGLGIMHPTIILAIFTALFFAIRQVISRYLIQKDNVFTIMFYTSFSASLITTVPLFFYWKNPTNYIQFIFLFLLSFLASIAEFFMIKSLENTETIVVAPIHYTLILWATLWGFIVFGDFPDFYTFLGAFIVTAAGIYVIRREYLIGKTNLNQK